MKVKNPLMMTMNFKSIKEIFDLNNCLIIFVPNDKLSAK